jgi:hypothetical protein
MAAPAASSVPSVPPSEEPNSFLFSLLTDMLNPGVRSQSVIFVNVVLGALLFVIFALVLLGHYNIHLLVLSVLTIIVLALFNWYAFFFIIIIIIFVR